MDCLLRNRISCAKFHSCGDVLFTMIDNVRLKLRSFSISMILFALFAGAVNGQQLRNPQVIVAQHHDVSPRLDYLAAHPSSLPGAKPQSEPDDDARWISLLRSKPRPASVADPVLQTSVRENLGTVPGLNFDGNPANGGWVVPDTEGATGATQFVEFINVEYSVYNKTTGALVLGPLQGNSLWSGFGGPCALDNNGDTIVVYDQLANRWVFSQHADSTVGQSLQCVAVSTTSDATGSYFRYSFVVDNNLYFPDYPKLTLWPDAYYLSINLQTETGFNPVAPYVCALDRTKMLTGATATAQCFQLSSTYQTSTLLPADLDGSVLPPPGAPNYMLSLATNALNIWQFHVDFTNPLNTTLTGPVALPVAAYSEACGGTICIPQPGTTQQVDSLGDRLMWRLAYRNFGAHESLVATHSVVANSSTGVRWYEIRSPASNPIVYQSGTYAPDSNYRWMGSIAMDRAGNIAEGYSVSSSTMFPSIRYSGWQPTVDSKGVFESENTLISGTGSETGSGRWGDYTSMTVDPSNDCTFWFVGQYQLTTGGQLWRTRIGSFSFPSCTNLISTTTALTSAPNPSMVGQPFVLTATVTSTSGTPSGSVTFQNGNSFLGTVLLNGSGVATLSVSTLPAGSYSIQAVYGGNGNFAYSGSNIVVQVVQQGGGTVAELSPTSLTFPIQNVGSSSAGQVVTLSNIGTGTLLISSISTGTVNFTETNNCGTSLLAGNSCQITVVFSPTTKGPLTDTLTVLDNATNSPQTATLSGTGGGIPVPFVNQPIVPWVAVPGTPGTTLTLNGAGFFTGATVDWNGSPRSTTFVSNTKLQAAITSADLAAAGTAVVSVVNTGVSPTSGISFFSVTNSTPVSSGLTFSQTTPSTGSTPTALAMGDFNGDGVQDLAVVNQSTSTVSIFIGLGDGTFKPHVDYATGADPVFVGVGDFNGDGKLDLVTTDIGSSSVSILLGNGNGTFQNQTPLPVAQGPQSLAIGDFNGDGALDIAVVGSSGSAVSILLGNGDGTFTRQDITLGFSPQSVATADLNGDGNLDLAIAVPLSGTVYILLGNGDGTFQTPVAYVAAGGPQAVAICDVNGDQIPDLVLADGTNNKVSILEGNGNGTFQGHLDFSVGMNPQAIACADLNGDGIMDVLSANFGDNTASVLLGNGGNTFTLFTQFVGTSPHGILAGDFNQDGRMDIAVVNELSNSVSLLQQSPTAVVAPSTLNFGTVVLNTHSAGRPVTITNNGTAALLISSITITGNQAPNFSQSNTCGASLSVGASCTVTVTFTPINIGNQSAKLSIADNASGSPQQVTLMGIGTVAMVTPTSLRFAPQVVGTTSAPQTVTLKNVGTGTMRITSVTLSGTNAGDFADVNSCPATLASQASCTVAVTFKPLAKGSRTAILNFTDNGGGSPQKVNLMGTGS
jgi:hypothetical protein